MTWRGHVDKLTKATILQFMKTLPEDRLGMSHGGTRFLRQHGFFRGVEWDNLVFSGTHLPTHAPHESRTRLGASTWRASAGSAGAPPQQNGVKLPPNFENLLGAAQEKVDFDESATIDKGLDALFADF